MATFYQSEIATGKMPAAIAHGVEVVAQRGVIALNAALVINDIFELCVLPAGHSLVDAMVDTDDHDGANPALVWNAGIMSGNVGVKDANRTVGNELFASATTGQSAGMARMTKAPAVVYPVNQDRSIGMKVATAPGTGITPDATALKPVGFWQPSTAYASGDSIVLPDGRRARCSTAGTSGTAFPFVGTTLVAGTVNDNTAVWTIVDVYFALTIWYRALRTPGG